MLETVHLNVFKVLDSKPFTCLKNDFKKKQMFKIVKNQFSISQLPYYLIYQEPLLNTYMKCCDSW